MALHLRIIAFFTVMFLSATEGVNIKLKGIQGGSITFPEPVVRGFLIFKTNIIANVKDRQLNILEDSYTDRLFWSDTTGDLTLRGLQKNDSGYFVLNIRQGVTFSIEYELTVYEPVAAPEVRVSVSAESCTLLCFVDKTEETTLLWYRDEEVLNQSSSADPSLPLTVHRQDITSSYRCVAANPAENKTFNVDVNIACWREDGKRGGEKEKKIRKKKNLSWWFLTPVLVFWGAIAVCIFYTDMNRERERV